MNIKLYISSIIVVITSGFTIMAQNPVFKVEAGTSMSPLALKELLQEQSSQGKEIVLPPGEFDFTGQTVNIDGDLVLKGTGIDQTIIKNGQRLVVNGSVDVQDITFKDWDRALYGAPTTDSIDINIERVGFNGFNYGVVWQEGDPVVRNVTVKESHFQNAGRISLNIRTHLLSATIKENLFEKYDSTYYSIIILGKPYKEAGDFVVEHNEFRNIRCYNPKAKSRYNCLMYGKRNSYSFNTFTGATIPVVYARGSINIMGNDIEVAGGQKDDGTFLLKGNHLVKPNIIALNKITGSGQSAIYSEVAGVEYIFSNHFEIDNKRALIRLNPELRGVLTKISQNTFKNRWGGGFVGSNVETVELTNNTMEVKHAILGNRSNAPEEQKITWFKVSDNVLRTQNWSARKINVKNFELISNQIFYGDANSEYEIEASSSVLIAHNIIDINNQVEFKLKNKSSLFAIKSPRAIMQGNEINAPIIRAGIFQVGSSDVELKDNIINMQPTRPTQVLMMNTAARLTIQDNQVESTLPIALYASKTHIQELTLSNNQGTHLQPGKNPLKK